MWVTRPAGKDVADEAPRVVDRGGPHGGDAVDERSACVRQQHIAAEVNRWEHGRTMSGYSEKT